MAKAKKDDEKKKSGDKSTASENAAKSSSRSRAKAGKTVKKKAAASKKSASAKKTTAQKGAQKKSAAKKTAKKTTAKSSAKKSASKKGGTPKKAATKKSSAKKTSAQKTARKAPKTTLKKAAASKATPIRQARTAPKPMASATGKIEPQVDNPALTSKQKKTLVKMLEEERNRILTFLAEIDGKSLAHGEEGERNRSSYSIHQADYASDDQSLNLALAQRQIEARRLEEIEHSLKKAQTRRYGKCRRCSANIGYDRMQAKPYAEYCIVCRNSLDPNR